MSAGRGFALAVVKRALTALPFAALFVLAIRQIARALGVSADLSTLDFPEVIPATVMPVAGTALGYFLSYRRPSPSSLRAFLVGSAVFTSAAIVVTVRPLWASGDAKATAATIAVDLAPALVAAVVFLRRGPRPIEASPAHGRSP